MKKRVLEIRQYLIKPHCECRLWHGIVLTWQLRGGSDNRSQVERGTKLGSSEQEQFTPSILQQDPLVVDRQTAERWNTLHPANRHEQYSGRCL